MAWRAFARLSRDSLNDLLTIEAVIFPRWTHSP
jgi:hypothetical protein